MLNLNELKAENVTLEYIRTATILRLPFHLCTGSIFHIVDPDNNKLHLWLRNKLSIPHNTEFLEQFTILDKHKRTESFSSGFLTDALIVDCNPKLRPDEFEAIRTGRTGSIGTASLRNPGFQLLNEIIGAHQMVRLGPYVSGMGALWPRMLTKREIFERILIEIVLLSDPDEMTDKNIVLRLFDIVDRWPTELGPEQA